MYASPRCMAALNARHFRHQGIRSQIYAGPHTNIGPETAQAALSSSRARLAQHPQSPIVCLVALLRLASFAPPLRYAQGVAEISKNPNPRPPLLLILHPHWSLQPLASTDRPPPRAMPV